MSRLRGNAMTTTTTAGTAAPPGYWHLVPLLYLATMSVLLFGIATSPYPYTDPRFVVGFFWTEAAVAILLLATFALVPGAEVGLRRPALVDGALVVPLAVLVATALGGWLAARLTLPAGAVVDGALSLGILRTTLLVGLTEEWVYRGLVFAALSRWLGLRRGAYLALVAFGLLHLLNMAAGVPPALAAMQFLTTMVVGSTLLLAAVGTRSIWLPVLAHGLYDFLVFDASATRAAGAPAWTALPGLAVTVAVGVYGLLRIRKLQGDAPYPVRPTSPAA